MLLHRPMWPQQLILLLLLLLLTHQRCFPPVPSHRLSPQLCLQ